MPVHALPFLLLLAAPAPAPSASAPAPATPALGEIVRRATAVQGRKPQQLTCRVESRAWVLDKRGRPEEEQLRERTETWTAGVSTKGPITRAVADGKPLDAAALAEEVEQDQKRQAELDERKRRGEGKEMEPIFSATRAALTSFTLLREDFLSGRPAFVLAFSPKPGAKDGRAGTAWVDAESFLAVRVDSSPQPLPDHVDRMDVEEEQQLTAAGETAPKRMRIDGSGGFLFLKRRFRMETAWSCQ